MIAVLAGVLSRRGPVEPADLDRLHAAAGPDGVVRTSGPLAVAWSGGESHAGEVLCVLAGRRYAGPEPAAFAAAAEPPAALRGDFALLRWDGREGYLARDQQGQCGALFHDDGTTLRFANEVVTLLGLLPRRPAPDERALAHWLGFSGQPPGLTLYEGVMRLSAGELLPLDASRRRAPRRWFTFRPGPLRTGSRADHVEALRAAIATGVERRVGPPGSTAVQLSGGLDSTTVAGLSTRLDDEARRTRRAYSAAFPDHPSVDESALIDRTCEDLGMESTKVVVRSGSVLSGALPYLERWALPPVSPNLFFWNTMLRQAADDGVTVLLDGEGGDELFGLSPYLVADMLARGRYGAARRLSGTIPGVGDHPPPEFVRSFLRRWGVQGLAPAWLHAASRRLRSPERHVPPYFRAGTARAFVEVADGAAWKRQDGPRWWRWLVWAVNGGMGPGQLYDHVRHRALMAGIEPRHPLVDVDTISFVLSLPPELAFDAHFTRPLVREAMEGLIPEAVRRRPNKSTFDAVFHEGLEHADAAAAAALLGPDARVGAYVDLAAARGQLVEATPPREGRGRMNWALLLWRLLTAECWLRAQEDPAAPREVAERAGMPPADVTIARGRSVPV